MVMAGTRVLQMFRDKTEGLEVVQGSAAAVTSVDMVLSQEGAVRLYEIVTPGGNTLRGNSNRAPKRCEGQEARGDHSRSGWERTG